MKTYSHTPDAYIAFFPFDVEDTLSPGLRDEAQTSPLIVHDEIIALETHKPKTGTGTWNVTLASNQDFKSKISPGNWCLIYISDQKLSPNNDKTYLSENSGLKMIGIVRSVRTSEYVDPATGIRMIRYKLAGDDFQSILNMKVYINATLKSLPAKNGQGSGLDAVALLGNKLAALMRPDEIVSNLLNAILGATVLDIDGADRNVDARAGMPYKIPPEVARRLSGSPAKDNKFVNFMYQNFQSDLLGKVFLRSEIGGQFTLWSLLQTYSHRILNELYSDLMPIKTSKGYQLLPTLVLRAIPFNTNKPRYDKTTLSIFDGSRKRADSDIKPGSGLHLYTSKFIDESEILSLDYGKSDQERFNFFFVVTTYLKESIGAEAYAIEQLCKQIGIKELQDSKSVSRHGLRPYITSSEFILDPEKDTTAVKINQIVKDMWSRAHSFDNGTVTLIGNADHIPVGTNIQFEKRKWIAHVEAIGHSFAVDSRGAKTFHTSINFVRLQTTDGKPLDASTDGPGQDWARGFSYSRNDE